MTKLIESFTIPIYEWKTVDAGQKTIRIKGVALRGDIVSKNNRKYTREALMKATNTWIGKPVNVNHDDRKRVGVIKWMDYDEGTDSLLYEAEINREPYISLLRNRSTEIRGLSVQADYIYNRCAMCGKKFYTEEEWYDHMMNEHFVKDLPTEPHGIKGSAISLVLSPEIPGYDGTTIQLAEMARQATLRLLETVIKTKQEEEKYIMNKALRTGATHVSVGKSGVTSNAILEQEEHECPEGEHWDAEQGKCVKNEPVAEQEHECPEGEHWSEEEQKCVPNTVEEQEDDIKPGSHYCEEHPDDPRCIEHKRAIHGEEQEHECPEGEHWDEEKQMCVANVASETEGEDTNAEQPLPPKQEEMCPPGFHWDEEIRKCVADPELDTDDYVQETLKVNLAVKETQPKTVTLKQSNITEAAQASRVKLKLGEPFADYSSFEDCVAKNQDKENPEAYCGKVKHEAEGEMLQNREISNLRHKLNEVIAELNKPITAQADNMDWREGLRQYAGELLKVVKYVNHMPKKDDLGWKRIKPFDDAPLREAFRKVKPYNDKPLRGSINEIYREIKMVNDRINNLKPYDDKPLKELITQQKKDFETILAQADKNIEENKKTLEERITALTKENEELKAKKLEETTGLAGKVEEINTKLENALDKQTGTFKGVAQKPNVEEKKQKNPDLTYKPGGK